jgi:hypothetical protein
MHSESTARTLKEHNLIGGPPWLLPPQSFRPAVPLFYRLLFALTSLAAYFLSSIVLLHFIPSAHSSRKYLDRSHPPRDENECVGAGFASL